MFRKIGSLVLVGCCLAGTAAAQIIDVDAITGEDGNLFNVETGSKTDYFVPFEQNSAGDDLWADSGFGGTTEPSYGVLSFTTYNEDSPKIKQVFDGLDPTRQYNIYARGQGYWWSDGPFPMAFYGVAAGLSENSIETAVLEDPNFGSEVSLLLGQVAGTDTVEVFADDIDLAFVNEYTGGQSKTAVRTYYFGLSYEDIGAAPVGVAGDFNENGVVDAADYAGWLLALGSDTIQLPNDDGLGNPIGIDHYNLWKSNVGNSAGIGSVSGSVPEPSAIVMLLAGTAFSLAVRRRAA